MKNQVFRVERHAPISIWCTRLCFIAVICLIGKYWVESKSMAFVGKTVFGGSIAISSAAIIASFIRSTAALLVMIVSVVAIPLMYAFLMDALVLRGAWWEWWIMFPVQIGIPAVWSYYLWKAEGVRSYYSRSAK